MKFNLYFHISDRLFLREKVMKLSTVRPQLLNVWSLTILHNVNCRWLVLPEYVWVKYVFKSHQCTSSYPYMVNITLKYKWIKITMPLFQYRDIGDFTLELTWIDTHQCYENANRKFVRMKRIMRKGNFWHMQKCKPRPAAASPTPRLVRICTFWQS